MNFFKRMVKKMIGQTAMRRTNLHIGAQHFHQGQEMGDWLPWQTAPRDGTPIEIRCTYGVAPWYGVYQFVNGEWIKFNDQRSGLMDGGVSCTWRPLQVAPENYVDPTGGAQKTAAYWRGAVAAKYGLPLGTFEAEARKNGMKD